MRESGSHFFYKESLLKEIKEVVDSFYRDVQIKICSIKKRQKREIRDMIMHDGGGKIFQATEERFGRVSLQ